MPSSMNDNLKKALKSSSLRRAVAPGSVVTARASAVASPPLPRTLWGDVGAEASSEEPVRFRMAAGERLRSCNITYNLINPLFVFHTFMFSYQLKQFFLLILDLIPFLLRLSTIQAG